MNWKKLYPSFVMELESIGANINRLEFLQRLQIWLKSSLGKWRPEVRARYGLDEYATLDLSCFPVNEASLSPAEEIPRLLAVPPSSVNSFAMQVSELFWQGITVESPIECPVCNHLQLRILEDPLTREVVFACDLCAWAQTENGEEWQQDRYLKPATKEVFAGWKSRNS